MPLLSDTLREFGCSVNPLRMAMWFSTTPVIVIMIYFFSSKQLSFVSAARPGVRDGFHPRAKLGLHIHTHTHLDPTHGAVMVGGCSSRLQRGSPNQRKEPWHTARVRRLGIRVGAVYVWYPPSLNSPSYHTTQALKSAGTMALCIFFGFLYEMSPSRVLGTPRALPHSPNSGVRVTDASSPILLLPWASALGERRLSKPLSF